MSTIRQTCPACSRLLELPGESVGRLGKCPACEATFTIAASLDSGSDPLPPAPAGSQPPAPSSESLSEVDEQPSKIPSNPVDVRSDASAAADVGSGGMTTTPLYRPPTPPPSPAETQPPTPSDPTPTRPKDPGYEDPGYEDPGYEDPGYEDPGYDWQSTAEHPFSLPLGSGKTESLPHAAYPNASSTGAAPLLTADDPPLGKPTIEDIITATFAIFGQRWPNLVLALLIVAAVMALVVLIPLLVIAAIADAGGELAARMLALIWVPLVALMASGACVGMTRVTLVVVRNSRSSPLSELTPPLSLVVRYFVGALLLSAALGAAAVAFAALMAYLASLTGNQTVSALMNIFTLSMLALATLTASWMFWSWPFIVSDGRGTAIGSLKTAMTLSMRNRLTSALLVLISIMMSAISTMLCGIGHLVTGPIMLVMLAIAYLQMSGQPIDQP